MADVDDQIIVIGVDQTVVESELEVAIVVIANDELRVAFECVVITELLEGNRGSLGDKDGMVPAVLRELSSSDGAEDVAVLIYQEKAVLQTGVGGRDVEIDPEPSGGSFSDGEGIVAVEEKRTGIKSLGNCAIRGIRVVIGTRAAARR